MRAGPLPDTIARRTDQPAIPEPPDVGFGAVSPLEQGAREAAGANEPPVVDDLDPDATPDHEEFERVSARGLRAIKERWERRRRRE